MADIRINALATTAASTASDDFIAVDGSANGTRKLNAYSPTFGGNLTVNGAAAVNGGNAVYGGGALLLGGSGGGSGNAVYTTDTGSPTIYTDHRGTSNTGDWYWRNGTGGANTRMILSGSGNLTVSGTASSTSNTAFPGAFGANGQYRLYSNSVTGASLQGQGSTYDVYIMARDGSGAITVPTGTTNVGIAGNLTVSGTGNSSVAGTLLVATTTNSSNGKIQLADHSTSAGGIGFGTTTSLYNDGTGILGLTRSDGGGTGGINIYSSSTLKARLTFSGSDAYLDAPTGQLIVRTNGYGTALTLDSSQNATFEKNINAGGASNDADIRLHLNAAGDTSAKYAALWRNASSNKIFHLRADGDLYTSAGATITGAIAIGNTVNTVSPTSPNRTITMVIGGTTYYIHAKTTND